ncbi:hypothetical protein [Actinomadura welshii]|uniref:hypothetical protein n=1 Tax=Actinomadura welshii TaxID=3103817 RepID=UPI0003AD747B|nr:hypothetical protein [Actinomadura madurae]
MGDFGAFVAQNPDVVAALASMHANHAAAHFLNATPPTWSQYYDHDEYRRMVWSKGGKPVIVRRGSPHGSGLGVHRCVVGRTISLLPWFRRPRIRWEIRDDAHEAFMILAAAIICWRRLVR